MLSANVELSSTFVVRSRPLGLRAGLSYENVEELLDEAEGVLDVERRRSRSAALRLRRRFGIQRFGEALLADEFNRPELTGLAMATLVGFVRISTSSRIMRVPFSVVKACAIVDE